MSAEEEAVPPEPRSARGRLSRERVVDCALDLIDEDGIEGLSMRRLATRVGAEPMSLYRHVPNRAALLDEVVATVLASVELPGPDETDWEAALRRYAVELPGPDETDWEAALRRYARSFRRALLEHANAFPLFATVGPEHPAVRRELEALIGLWARVGLDRRTAMHAQATLMAFLFGSVGWTVRGGTAPAGARRPSPVAAESIFEFGLDAIMAGLRERLRI